MTEYLIFERIDCKTVVRKTRTESEKRIKIKNWESKSTKINIKCEGFLFITFS